MADLLLELGCEELPATFVKKAYQDLADAVASRLEEAGVPFRHGEPPLGTPRRLIVHLTEVAERQPDRTHEIRGPSVAAAYGSDGAPTKALEGFCRGQGVELSAVRKEGDYVWVSKNSPGRPTEEILAEILPEAIRSLSFEKSMRWGQSRMRFARPIRWILALFDGRTVRFEIENVCSGNYSRGHRFDYPEPFEVRSYDDLVDGLITRRVEPDPAEREKRIREGAVVMATGEPDLMAPLVDENVFLTEWPTPIEGQFREEYLALPEPVLTTAMAKHEKMFPVRGRDGRLINRFIFVRNSGDDATVRAGAEWVLNARFNDAKFFFDEDRKHSLADFLEKTSGILFQEKLGTVRQRADRLAAVSAEVARATGAPEGEIELARQAGLYCKADLSTGLVGELASLQGVVGAEYAQREGFPEAVCWAIGSHYDLAKNPKADSPKARTALRVLIADQLDKLVGYLGVGLLPSGSSDPFGLRRASSLLVEAAFSWPDADLSFDGPILVASVQAYAKQGIAIDANTISKALRGLLEARYESLLDDERPDLVSATLEWIMRPSDARFRLAALKELADDREFVQTATRPINILSAAVQKGQFSPKEGSDWEGNLNSKDGDALLASAREVLSSVQQAAGKRDSKGVAESLRKLTAPIDRFFESTMVMDEDPTVRSARLQLVQVVTDALKHGGDFSKVVLEGP